MDERVAAAIAHWEPRFTANGVAPPDFARITSGLERWADWCSAWSAVGAEHEALGRAAAADGRLRSAGAHLAQAAVYFHFAKFVFVDDLEQMRAAHARAVACLTDALPHLDPPGERVTIPFEGSTLVGILRRPAGRARPDRRENAGRAGECPCVILIPGLDSTKEEFRPTESLFLERGMATFSVDGPGQGEAEYDLAIRADWEVPGAAIIDRISSLEGIDPQRLGVWGVSLGGYYAPRVASGDGRVKACIALAGPYNFGHCWERLPPQTRDTYRVRSHTASEDEARAHALTLTLEGRTGAIRAPLLVVMGKLDRLIPWEQAQRLADETPSSELILLEDGNHGCANVAYKHRYLSADWMGAQLGA